MGKLNWLLLTFIAILVLRPQVTLGAPSCERNNTSPVSQGEALSKITTACNGACEAYSGHDTSSFGPVVYTLGLTNLFSDPKELTELQSKITNFLNQSTCANGCRENNKVQQVKLTTLPEKLESPSKCIGKSDLSGSSTPFTGNSCEDVEKKAEKWSRAVLLHDSKNSLGVQLGDMAGSDCSITSNFTTVTKPDPKGCSGYVMFSAKFIPHRLNRTFITTAEVHREWHCEGPPK